MKRPQSTPHDHFQRRIVFLSVASTLSLLGIILYLSGFSPRRALSIGYTWFSNHHDEDDFNDGSFPDFGMYKDRVKILNEDEFPLTDPKRRVIIMGDIHGMNDSFHSILTQLSYTPNQDILLHVGDVLTKGPHRSSMATLDFMTRHNVLGVRGNHEQQVIEWRAWMDWIRSSSEGGRWLDTIDRRWEEVHKLGKDTKKWLRNEIQRIPSKWVKRIPKKWKLFGEQYRIARQLTDQEWKYLQNLPVVLHIPHAHMYIVHAGLLPFDPRRDHKHHSQPLSKMPVLLRPPSESALRFAQETAVLDDIKPNKDPWSLLNMRAILQGKVTRRFRGVFWAKLWNREMKQCRGFDKNGGLYCLGATVVYGHTAKRGFEQRRWSIGLDSGCAHGKRLSALVLGGEENRRLSRRDFDDIPHPEDDEERDGDVPPEEEELENEPELDLFTDLEIGNEDDEALSSTIVRWGDANVGKVVSVRCRLP
ncbi:Metallo-dependent phosphatase-like protein [Flagelloscypha sp. PMI_526]|nr:Metallo-dependent phosphatase-like protein [Flagelloscypha sp. PMI_526]